MHNNVMFAVLTAREWVHSDIVMYSEFYRTDQSQTKYRPESSTQTRKVNPPP